MKLGVRSIIFLFLCLAAVVIMLACGMADSSLRIVSVRLRSQMADASNASISTTYNLSCASVFGGSTSWTQSAIVVSGTSGSLQIVQNHTCTITISSFFDGTSTYTPTGSSLVITVTAAGSVSSSGSLSNPPPYQSGSGAQLYFFLTSSTSTSLTFEYAYDPTMATASVVSPCTSGTCSSKPAYSSSATSFNSTIITASNYIWFTNSFSLSGLNTNVTTNIFITDATATFTSGSVYTVNFPDAVITFSPSLACGTTTYSQNMWQTTFPTLFPGGDTIFGQGVAMPVSTSLPGSISPVTYQARFYSDQPGVTVNWVWGAAVYSTNMTNYTSLGVKSGMQSDCTDNSNNPPGTPESKKSSLVKGATGNGGMQYTGHQTGTTSVSADNCIPVCSGTNVRCPLVCQAPPLTF